MEPVGLGSPPVEEVPCGSGCAGEGAFPCGEDGPEDPGGAAPVPDCGFICFVAGGAVGEVDGSAVLLATGAGGAPAAVEGFGRGEATGACPAVAGLLAVADDGLDGVPAAGGLRLDIAAFEEVAGVAMTDGCGASAGKAT